MENTEKRKIGRANIHLALPARSNKINLHKHFFGIPLALPALEGEKISKEIK